MGVRGHCCIHNRLQCDSRGPLDNFPAFFKFFHFFTQYRGSLPLKLIELFLFRFVLENCFCYSVDAILIDLHHLSAVAFSCISRRI